MILGRVSISDLENDTFNAAKWQFYKQVVSENGNNDSNWVSDMNQAAHIISDPGKISMTAVQYIGPLEKYIMIQWYFTGSGDTFFDNGVWDFYESSTPWGPWEKFSSQESKLAF